MAGMIGSSSVGIKSGSIVVMAANGGGMKRCRLDGSGGGIGICVGARLMKTWRQRKRYVESE